MSPPAPSDTLMTVEEFERYRGDESWLYELLRGVLVREPGPGPIHGRLQSRMAYLLERWMEEWGERGAVMTHTGFVLEEDPPTARLPDVAWVPPERIPEAGCGTSLWRQGPDLAGEVTSPSNSWTEIQEKVTEYLAAGTRLVWVVDPPTRTVTTYRSDIRARRLSAGEELDGEVVLPGSRIDPGRYFEVRATIPSAPDPGGMSRAVSSDIRECDSVLPRRSRGHGVPGPDPERRCGTAAGLCPSAGRTESRNRWS